MSYFSYYEIYKRDPKIARLFLVKSYEETGSISKTGRLFRTTRNTVRKAVRRFQQGGEEALTDRSRRPKHFYRKTEDKIEEEVLDLRENTHYGKIRLCGKLSKKGINIPPSTIGNILRRHGKIKPRQKKSFVGKWVNYYEWDKIHPLEQFQVDLKDILDFKTLPKDVYFHIVKLGLPRYQWTAICVKTRLRFLAYSEEKSFANGLAFMMLLTL